MGRPAGGHNFNNGRVSVGLQLFQSNKPLLLECFNETRDGSDSPTSFATSRRDNTVIGTLVIKPALPPCSDSTSAAQSNYELHTQLDELVSLLRNDDALSALSLTRVDSLIVARYLGQRSDEAKLLLERVRSTLRPVLFSTPAHTPRIWAT